MDPRPTRQRPHVLRLVALFCLFSGVVIIIVYAGGMWQGVREQERLNQAWVGQERLHQTWTTQTKGQPVIDSVLQHPVDGVDFALRVPRLGYFAAVKEGISTSVLDASPGHYPQTVWPGNQGTVGVAAHNIYWINFPRLTRGDEIDLETRYGAFKYHVPGSVIVNPDDRTVLVPDAPGYHLTLTTCWPLWAGAFATQRYVIFTDQFSPST